MNATMKVLLAMVAIAGVLFAGCSRLDGVDPGDGGALGADGGLVSGQACKVDTECGTGRYCSDDKVCAIDCVRSKDCAYLLSDPTQKNTMECSACGRCMGAGEADTKCAPPVDNSQCKADKDCIDLYGSAWICGPKKTCVRTCMQDLNCKEVGRGWYCSSEKLCYRKCTRDLDCILHGWNYVCPLPEGVDGDTNAYAKDPVVKECVDSGSIDWGGSVDKSKASYAWHGVWGMELNTAVRTTGLPLINQQDTVSNQYLLTKVVQDGNGITFDLKWCTIDLKNFKEDDSPFQDVAYMVTPDLYVDHIFIQYLHGLDVPELAARATFTTDKLLEIRGAKLANPETDELPNWDTPNLEGQWDQDNDVHPGMTNVMTGVLTAEIYNAQRWTCILNVNAVDKDHLRGLVEHTSQQNVLGASKEGYVYDTVSTKHPQADRSFFKALRMDDTASCNDVIAERNKKGSWLYFSISEPATIHYDPNARP